MAKAKGIRLWIPFVSLEVEWRDRMPRFKLSEERENLFSLYQVVYPYVLSTLVGAKVFELEQEVPLNGKKVDIYACTGKINENIYVEIQLITADVRHMEKVKEIITDIEQGIVVWEALSFQGREHLVKEVVELVRWLNKPVDILFVEVNSDVIPFLDELKTLYPLDVIPNLNRLSEVREPFGMIAEYRGRNILGGDQDDGLEAVNGSRQQGILEPVTISTRLGANKYILERIRKILPFYPGGYRAKSRLDTNALTFGAGNGNTFEICIRDSYSHVKLRIPKKNGRTCVQVKMDKMMIENRVGYGIYLREERSSYILDVPILSSAKRPRIDVLDEVVEVFKRFVTTFTQYFYCMEEEEKVVGAR